MKNQIRIILILTLAGISNMAFAQETSIQKQNKVSVNLYKSFSDFGTFMTGLEVEYYHGINRWIGYAISAEGSHFNNIPRNPDAYKNAQAFSSYGAVLSTDENYLDNKNISQYAFAGHFYFTPVNNAHHVLYISAGLGYSIQDITHQYVSDDYIVEPTQTTKVKAISYSFKATRPIIGLVGLGYDYKLNKGWSVGANLRGQVGVIRDRYYYKNSQPSSNYTFDDIFRFGIKVGKYF